ncbi:MAG: ATP-binding protein [Bacteroidales bacterium]|nr:ATP-binding protein [Bacteroidales bacterium]
MIALIGIALVLQTVSLIRYVNRINVRIENFFLAHLNGEVPDIAETNRKNKEFFRLNEYFSRINKEQENIRIKTEIQNSYFKTIIDQTTTGLLSYTGEGEVDFVNDAARKIFGIYVLRHIRKLDTIKEGLSKILLDLGPGITQLVPIVINGELIQISVKKTKFKSGDRLLYLVTLQNIKSELDTKEMESWQKLIRVLTHEIMNSITPITSLVNTISRIYRERDTGRILQPAEITAQAIDKTVKGLDIIETRGIGLVDFVKNFRDVNKLPKPQFEKIDVNGLLHQIKILFDDPYSTETAKLKISCPAELTILADRHLIEQVLINLIKNSFEACSETLNPVIRLSAYQQYDRTFIEVEDNGKGIPEVVMENIFVPFFTTKEKGSGIGLSLSRQIIRMHGGTLEFHSVPGEMTIFTIRI